jgi:hypothetical protein
MMNIEKKLHISHSQKSSPVKSINYTVKKSSEYWKKLLISHMQVIAR